jgi:hypothetical protein
MVVDALRNALLAVYNGGDAGSGDGVSSGGDTADERDDAGTAKQRVRPAATIPGGVTAAASTGAAVRASAVVGLLALAVKQGSLPHLLAVAVQLLRASGVCPAAAAPTGPVASCTCHVDVGAVSTFLDELRHTAAICRPLPLVDDCIAGGQRPRLLGRSIDGGARGGGSTPAESVLHHFGTLVLDGSFDEVREHIKQVSFRARLAVATDAFACSRAILRGRIRC